MIRLWLAATLRGEMPGFDESKLGSVDEVLAAASEHGVTVLLHEQIKLNQDKTVYPRTLLDRLAEIERSEIAAELFRLAETRMALACLRSARIPVLVLKGTALAYGLYAKPYLRPRVDTDILLQNAAAAEAAGNALEAIGYECQSMMPRPGKNAISFEMPYIRTSKHGTGNAIDIHWALANNALYGSRFSNAELMTESRDTPMVGEGAKGLGWFHAMAHACMHRVAHIPEGQGDKLIWLYDMHLLAARFTPQDWQTFLAQAEKRQLAGAFYSGLEETVKVFHTDMPANVLPKLFAFSKQESFDVGRAASPVYFDWHNLRWMTNGQRWNWFLQTFFPPVEYMMKRDSLKSRAQLPWAYMKRIIQRLL